MLAQQTSGYDVGGRNFHIQEQPMRENFNFSCVGTDQLAKLTDQVRSAGFLVTSLVNSLEKLPNRPYVTSSDMMLGSI
jgi:hypothetical protein